LSRLREKLRIALNVRMDVAINGMLRKIIKIL